MPAAPHLSRRVLASSSLRLLPGLSYRCTPFSPLPPSTHYQPLSTSTNVSSPSLFNLYSRKPPLPPLSNLSPTERWAVLKHAHGYVLAGKQAGLTPPQILRAAQADVSAGRLSPDGYAVVANVATPRGWRATAMMTLAYVVVAVAVANLYWTARGWGRKESNERVEKARRERMKRMEAGAERREQQERETSRRMEWLERLGKAQDRVKVAEAPRTRRLGRSSEQGEAE